MPELVSSLVVTYPGEAITSEIHKQLALLFETNRHNLLAAVCFPAVLLRVTLSLNGQQVKRVFDFVVDEGKTATATDGNTDNWKVK